MGHGGDQPRPDQPQPHSPQLAPHMYCSPTSPSIALDLSRSGSGIEVYHTTPTPVRIVHLSAPISSINQIHNHNPKSSSVQIRQLVPSGEVVVVEVGATYRSGNEQPWREDHRPHAARRAASLRETSTLQKRQHDWRRRGGRRNLLLGIHGDRRDRGARAGPGGTRRLLLSGADDDRRSEGRKWGDETGRTGAATSARLPVKSPRTNSFHSSVAGESGIARRWESGIARKQARLPFQTVTPEWAPHVSETKQAEQFRSNPVLQSSSSGHKIHVPTNHKTHMCHIAFLRIK